MMHLPPDAVREMDFEDVVGLLAYSTLEAEYLETAREKSSGPTTKHRLKKR